MTLLATSLLVLHTSSLFCGTFDCFCCPIRRFPYDTSKTCYGAHILTHYASMISEDSRSFKLGVTHAHTYITQRRYI